MTHRGYQIAWLALILIVAACAPSAAPAASTGAAPVAARTAAPIQRTLVMLNRGELPSIAAKPLQSFSGSLVGPIRMFNAMLDYMDESEAFHPYQAEALPQLNTDSWQVFPDGTMQTSYHLRPNLTWHDGQPLTADDFVFGWQVYSTPELGAAAGAPIGQMAQVLAPDPRTVVIKWKRLYPDASGLDTGFQALPAHILREPLQQLDPEGFVNQSFWTRDYVGSGPYRITDWTPGASIDGSAFEGHVLGKPKIEQVRILFTPDPNTALALMLSGEAQFAHDWVFFYEEAATLEQEAKARNIDIVLDYAPALLRLTGIQHRPDVASPASLLDPRVRRAIAWGIDNQGAVDATTGGHGLATTTLTSPRSPRFKAIESVVPQRHYDPRMVAQSFEEAGFAKGPDGFFQEPGGKPFHVEYATDGGPSPERENAIYVDSLRQAGVDAVTYVIPIVQLRDLQARALRPGLTLGGMSGKALNLFTSSEVPRPENRWAGQNRGGYSSADYDRVWQAFDTELDPATRDQHAAELERLLYEDTGAIPNIFTVAVNARAGSLQGPKVKQTPDAAIGALYTHLWEWTR